MSTPIEFMLAVVCAVWLAAGLVDYACHRRTHIELSAGVSESLLHLAQFLVLGVSVIFAVGTVPSLLSFVVVALGVVGHTALAFIDVAYTDRRRRILPLEQHVHGYLDVLPLIATGLFAVQHWDRLAAGISPIEWSVTENRHASIGLAIYVLFVGSPILEELLRTLRYARILKRASNTSIVRGDVNTALDSLDHAARNDLRT